MSNEREDALKGIEGCEKMVKEIEEQLRKGGLSSEEEHQLQAKRAGLIMSINLLDADTW